MNRSVPVKVERLSMSFGSVQAVRGVDFAVAPGSTVTLLGPSGCGKTTTLRCIAGLEVPSSGRITVGDRVVYDGDGGVFVEPERRNIGMVFQSYAIWPHMTVAGNVGFPLAMMGVGKREAAERTQAILDLVGLSGLQTRPAAALSGGQQQRVALARALVHEPQVVLFDEPLSNLDANLRERMRAELQLLQARLGFTAIFVTHDQHEALSLSDRIVIMNRGAIEQAGTPQEIFQHPRTAFTARFLGYSNALKGRLAGVGDGGAVAIDLNGGHRLAARWRAETPPQVGADCVVAIRPDRVQVRAAAASGFDNGLPGLIETAAFLGSRIDYTVKAGAIMLQAEGPIDHPASRGDQVTVGIAAEHCHAFPASE